MTSTNLRNEARAFVRTLSVEQLMQLARHESQYPRYVEDIAQTELIRRKTEMQNQQYQKYSNQPGVQRIPMQPQPNAVRVVSAEMATNPPQAAYFTYRKNTQQVAQPSGDYQLANTYKTKHRAELDGKKANEQGYNYRIKPFLRGGKWEYALYVKVK